MMGQFKAERFRCDLIMLGSPAQYNDYESFRKLSQSDFSEGTFGTLMMTRAIVDSLSSMLLQVLVYLRCQSPRFMLPTDY